MPVPLIIASSTVAPGTVTTDRVVASAATLLAVVALVIGTMAWRRSTASGRGRRAHRQSVGALVAGLVSAAVGAVILATADGGPGTGNGVVGGYAAIVVGLAAAGLGGTALARARRTA